MPVPVSRQRAIPAVESFSAPAVPGSQPGLVSEGATPTRGGADSGTPAAGDAGDSDDALPAVVDNPTNLTLLVIEDDPTGALSVPPLRRSSTTARCSR